MSAHSQKQTFSALFRPREHDMQEHVSAGGEVFGLSVFGFVMTDSVFARYEDHPRRRLERQVAGVMPGVITFRGPFTFF